MYYVIQVQEQALQLIINTLGKLPHDEVRPLIDTIYAQVRQQEENAKAQEEAAIKEKYKTVVEVEKINAEEPKIITSETQEKLVVTTPQKRIVKRKT